MPFSGGTFSLYSTGNPVVTGTSISSTWANATLSDIATGLTTCVLKDGTQTMTANLPMGGFKLTGLAAGTTAGDSLRYEQGMLLSTVTTAGDLIYGTGASAITRLGIGSAGGLLIVNSGATAPAWLGLGAAGGILKVNAGATAPEYLAIGTAYQRLAVNSGATAPEWVADTQNTVVTTAGDIMQATGNRTLARLAIGTARQVPMVNAGATALAYANPITVASMVASTSGSSVTFTGLPAGLRRVTMLLSGFSTNGTAVPLVQIGEAGGSYATTGYLGSGSGTGAGIGTANYTAGVGLRDSWAATYLVSGRIVWDLMDAATNLWICTYVLSNSDSAVGGLGGGKIALAGTLDRIRIITTDTLDAGNVGLSYE